MAGRKGMRRAPVEERFWQFVVKRRGCWGWTGATQKDWKGGRGYGKLGSATAPSGVEYAHRVSWRIHYGEPPSGAWVLHRCDNPQCTNPKHLFLGDSTANVRDMWAKQRQRGQFKRADFCGWGHPMSGENLYVAPSGTRHCRACRRRRREA